MGKETFTFSQFMSGVTESLKAEGHYQLSANIHKAWMCFDVEWECNR